MDEVHPSIEDCRADPDRFRGREVYVGVALVEGIEKGEAGGVIVRKEKTPVRVTGALPGVEMGERVSILGEFEPPDAIRPRRWTRHPGYVWKRTWMWAFSAGAAFFVLALLARRYRLVIGLPMFIPRS